MAGPLASFVAEKVLHKLRSLVAQEGYLALGVINDLGKLSKTLTTIKAVLLDADEKQGHNHQVRVWLEKLRDIFYDAEDVLDEFEVEALRSEVVDRQSITRKVCYFFSCSNPLALHFMMAHKIKRIRESLDEIVADKVLDEIGADKANFHLTPERIDNEHDLLIKMGEAHSLVHPLDVIGRDEDKENIINLLMQPCDGENVSVIPIIGIGGLGKTALAKLVYNDERVQKHFELKMWVCVSDEFVVKQLIIKVIKSAVGKNHDNSDLDQLQKLLRETLGGKKYLLVMDDVWNEDPKMWGELKNLLWEGANGSKIIVTTRSNRVASIMGTMRGISGYKLEGLPFESCVSLFNKCAFREGKKAKHPKLMKLGEEIVKKCGGIPLAVKSLGSLLYSSTNEQDWKRVRDNEIWKLEQKEKDVLPALRLSYDLLPPHLKQCFVYCSFFPKDYLFRSDELIQFWMAQGLFQPFNEYHETENIGMQYLKELWSTSFFQDFEQEINLVVFKMHDVIHDLALLIAKKDYLIVNFKYQNISKNAQHLSFVGVNTSKKGLSNLGRVKTICFQDNVERSNQSFVESYISRFQLLHVLVLRNSNIDVLPEKIGNLKYLKYLDLSNCGRIKKLPKSICKLQSLQTLYLEGCKELKELPREIRNVISLRALCITTQQKCLRGIEIEYLNSLRYLLISKCVNVQYLIEDISRLKFLRTLKITDCPSLVSLPHDMKYLRSLQILIVINCQNLDLNLGLEHIHDQDLTRTGFELRMLWIGELPQLMELPQWLLRGSVSTLRCLQIEDCLNFMVLPQLLQNLKSLTVLRIIKCPKLLSLRGDIQSLTALREIQIKGCPELRKTCEQGRGEDWHKIAHVPDIWLDDKIIKSGTY